MRILFFLSLASIAVSACTMLPPSFTAENIMKIHQGMSSNEILTMFGEPDNIDVSICGMSPNQWTCTTWEYGWAPHGDASFTFSGKHSALKLNDFEVNGLDNIGY